MKQDEDNKPAVADNYFFSFNRFSEAGQGSQICCLVWSLLGADQIHDRSQQNRSGDHIDTED
jgi:hypothetical protein